MISLFSQLLLSVFCIFIYLYNKFETDQENLNKKLTEDNKALNEKLNTMRQYPKNNSTKISAINAALNSDEVIL